MKRLITTFLTLPGSLVLAGCSRGGAEVSTVADTMIVGPEFTTSKGLFVPDDTRQSLGLRVVDIDERPVSSTLELSLRIYERADDSIRAAGIVAAGQAQRLAIGQPVRGRTRAGENVAGLITHVNAHMQQLTDTLEVLVEFPGSTTVVAPGSFVSGTVEFAAASVTCVPRSALIHSTEGDFVYAVSGEHFVRTPVTVGAINAEFAEIKEGLYSGDQVVAEPAMALWLTELAATKGGHACCVVPAKGK